MLQVDIQLPTQVKNDISLKVDAVMEAIKGRSADQISAWVDNNVTNLSTDLNVIKRILKLLLIYISTKG